MRDISRGRFKVLTWECHECSFFVIALESIYGALFAARFTNYASISIVFCFSRALVVMTIFAQLRVTRPAIDPVHRMHA